MTTTIIYDPEKSEPTWSRGLYKIGGVWFKPGRNILNSSQVANLKKAPDYENCVKRGAFTVIDEKEIETLTKKKVKASLENKDKALTVTDLGVKEVIALAESEDNLDLIAKWVLEEKDGKNRQSVIDYLETKLKRTRRGNQ